MTRSLLHAITSTALFLGSVAPALAQLPDREVLTREDLQALAIHRLSDLIEWLGRGVATAEGLGWQVQLDAVVPPEGLAGSSSTWRVVIDEQLVEVRSLGALFPELLPLGVQQIDSVTVIRGPALAAGLISGGGAVHIHTSGGLERGPRAGAWSRYGAETGDPGPYFYTPHATPNVDRTGPDGSAWAGYGGRGWSIEGEARYLRTDVSDQRLRERYGDQYLVFTQARGGGARFTADLGGGRHVLIASEHNQRGHVFLPDLQDFRRANLTASHLGASGEWSLGQHTSARYRASRSEIQSLHEAYGSIGSTHRLSRGSADIGRAGNGWEMRGGVGLQRTSDESSPGTGNRMELSGSYLRSATVGDAESGALSARLDVAIARVDHEWSELVSAAVARPLASHLQWDASAAWFSEPKASASFALDGSTSVLRLTSGLAGSRSGIIGRIGAIGGVLRSRAPKLGRGGQPDTEIFGLQASAKTISSSRLRGDLLHEITWASGHASLPVHVTRGRLSYRLAPTFLVSSSLQARSGYSPLERATLSAETRTELPPYVRLDVAAQKDLWLRRVRVQFAIKNLFGAPERHMPEGGEFGLRYFATGYIALP